MGKALAHHLAQAFRSFEQDIADKAVTDDDIRAARERGDSRHAAVLKTALKHYVSEHHPGHTDGKP